MPCTLCNRMREEWSPTSSLSLGPRRLNNSAKAIGHNQVTKKRDCATLFVSRALTHPSTLPGRKVTNQECHLPPVVACGPRVPSAVRINSEPQRQLVNYFKLDLGFFGRKKTRAEKKNIDLTHFDQTDQILVTFRVKRYIWRWLQTS